MSALDTLPSPASSPAPGTGDESLEPAPAPPGEKPKGGWSAWYGRVFNFSGLTRGMLARPVGIVCLIGVVVGVVLPPTGIGFSTCGMLTLFGVPCPGCGLTRSVSSFLQGHFLWSLEYHPLGWVFALSFVLIGSTALMPRRWREAIIARVSRHEQAIGSGFLVFCTLLLLYGMVRMALVQTGVESQQWWRTTHGSMPPFIQQDAAPPAPEGD